MPKVYSGILGNIFSKLGRMNLTESIVLTQYKNQFRINQTKIATNKLKHIELNSYLLFYLKLCNY